MTDRKRCAVYTRKSSEEGLEQEFNSLDAQAEACAAYILSQAGEGWENTNTVYSDAGISGGHMERVGLQKLLEQIKDGKVDVIVVYKVDRLTRSLADFAKLVEIFDQYDVSFVSVTQAFNTTNSMGRLTLNVLLSFAQFEREVTAERIRDKIAASKKKGKWMGGLPPLGYTNIDTKLVVEKDEAKQVQAIFELYLKIGTVGGLKVELDSRGYLTKRRKTAKQQQVGGRPFSRGHLYKLLSSPVYIGKVVHKENVYDGEHKAIISDELWDQVQALLTSNAPIRNRKINLKSGGLLTGLLYDQTGDRLSPIHANKKGRKYRYYISNRLTKGELDDGSAWRLPAKQIEGHIQRHLLSILSDQSTLIHLLELTDPDQTELLELESKCQIFKRSLQHANPIKTRKALVQIIDRIEIRKAELIIKIRTGELLEQRTEETATLIYPLQQKRRGVETRLVIGGRAQNEPDKKLIQAIAKSMLWFDQLKKGTRYSILDIAKNEDVDSGDVSRALPLAFLAPSIIQDILSGNQPVELTVDSLKRKTANLPTAWNDQRNYLGFTR
jgi:DNA invertase Pin-like site-specific DNA recombinase